MKKILICFLTVILLCGCSSKKSVTTFMLTRDDKVYALYNTEGKKLTDYLYQSYQEVEGIGYIVRNQNNQVGLISSNGKELIAFGEYELLEATDQMFFATKKTEVKEDTKKNDTETADDKDIDEIKQIEKNQFLNENLYVLDSNGKVLYSANAETSIMRSGLPIIKKDNEYIVLCQDGEELYHDSGEIKYAYSSQDHSLFIIGLTEQEKLYYPDTKKKDDLKELTIETLGHFQFLLQNENGALLYDSDLKTIIYIDFKNEEIYQHPFDADKAYYDDSGNMILESQQKQYIFSGKDNPIALNTYYLSSLTYLRRYDKVYGPHTIIKEGKESGELENVQLSPIVRHLYTEVYPVYVLSEGYVYYNFEGKKVIDQTYLEADIFDIMGRAVVQLDETGYSLIDENGKVLTNHVYNQIKYIGSSYYAVYNDSGLFGIIDKEGKEVLPVEYLYLPETPIIEFDGESYLFVGKNGRSYIYDMNNKMKEVFSVEGELVYYEKGYFRCNDQYYTIEGELME